MPHKKEASKKKKGAVASRKGKGSEDASDHVLSLGKKNGKKLFHL